MKFGRMPRDEHGRVRDPVTGRYMSKIKRGTWDTNPAMNSTSIKKAQKNEVLVGKSF